MHILTFFRKQIYKQTDQSTSITLKNTVGLQLISATTFAFRSSLKFHLNACFEFFSTDRPTDRPTNLLIETLLPEFRNILYRSISVMFIGQIIIDVTNIKNSYPQQVKVLLGPKNPKKNSTFSSFHLSYIDSHHTAHPFT